MRLKWNKIGEKNPHLKSAHQYSKELWNEHEHAVNDLCRFMFKVNLIELEEVHTSSIDRYCRSHGCYDEYIREEL